MWGALIGAGLGAVTSSIQMIQASKQRREAQKFIDNFEPEELSNKFNDLQVSTLGADLKKEQDAMNVANATEAIRSSGSRAILGGTSNIINQSTDNMQKVGANLDQQQKSLDVLGAKDDVRIETIKEKRSQDELAGYGKMLDVANDSKKQAWSNMLKSVSMGASSMFGTSGDVNTNTFGGDTTNENFGLGGYTEEELRQIEEGSY